MRKMMGISSFAPLSPAPQKGRQGSHLILGHFLFPSPPSPSRARPFRVGGWEIKGGKIIFLDGPVAETSTPFCSGLVWLHLVIVWYSQKQCAHCFLLSSLLYIHRWALPHLDQWIAGQPYILTLTPWCSFMWIYRNHPHPFGTLWRSLSS